MRGKNSTPNHCRICGMAGVTSKTHGRHNGPTLRPSEVTRGIRLTRPLTPDKSGRLRRESPLVSRRVRSLPPALLPGTLTRVLASFELPSPGLR